MGKGDSRGFAQLISGRQHVHITNEDTTLKSYENTVVLTASSAAFDVTLPHPAECEDRMFTFVMTADASSCGVTVKEPAAGSTSDVLGWQMKYDHNNAVLYSDGIKFWELASTSSS